MLEMLLLLITIAISLSEMWHKMLGQWIRILSNMCNLKENNRKWRDLAQHKLTS